MNSYCFAIRRSSDRKYSPTRVIEGKSSSRMSKNSSDTRAASALPPNVEPCMPGRIDFAARSFATMMPSGIPQATGLAATMISGITAGSANW